MKSYKSGMGRRKSVSVKRVRLTVNSMAETKKHVYTSSDNLNVAHNNILILNENMLDMRTGFDGGGSSTGDKPRDGNKIFLKGIAIRLMVENKVDRTDVTYRLMVLKTGKYDPVNRDTLFMGISGNKMLDYINQSRYTVLFQKWYKVRAPNQGTSASANVNGTYDTADIGDNDIRRMNPGTKIIKEWIPFNRTIQYRDDPAGVPTSDTQTPKFFDYKVVLFAYDHYGTPQDVNLIGTCNDYVQQLYFKDF